MAKFLSPSSSRAHPQIGLNIKRGECGSPRCTFRTHEGPGVKRFWAWQTPFPDYLKRTRADEVVFGQSLVRWANNESSVSIRSRVIRSLRFSKRKLWRNLIISNVVERTRFSRAVELKRAKRTYLWLIIENALLGCFKPYFSLKYCKLTRYSCILRDKHVLDIVKSGKRIMTTEIVHKQ